MTDEPIPLDEARRRLGNREGGRDAIRAAIAGAPAVPQQAAPSPEPADTVPDGEGGRLVMEPHGLVKRSEGRRPVRISGYFEVLSQTRDDDAIAWGLLLRFHDPDGILQQVVVTRDQFTGDGGELKNMLARRGLYVNPSQAARGALNEYLSRVVSDKRARVVNRTGWHKIDGVRVFVLPGRTFGSPPVEVIYQPSARDVALFNQAGTLDQWRDEVAALCAGNSRLMLAVSAAFAGPLLEIVGEEGGGLHFRGASRVGKTTALRVAASVWGDEAGSGAGGYIRQWRATGNALEGVAAAQSDTLLPLDELGQADPREVGDTAYLLASGLGKARSDRTGGLRAPIRFRVLFLSTGELSRADKIAEAGRKVKAGQEVRLVDIPADAGAGMGLFEELHDVASAEELTQHLRVATTGAYGVAAPVFLEHMVALAAAEPDLSSRLRMWMDSLLDDWMQTRPDAGGQVRSVTRRFAMIAVAGELATQAGITGWVPSLAGVAAGICFEAWLSERGTTGAREDAQAVSQLRDFITTNGLSRFEDWRDPEQREGHQGDPSRLPLPTDRFRIANRAGWRRQVLEDFSPVAWHYFLTAHGMAEALSGLDRPQALKVLVARGFVVHSPGRETAGSYSPPGHPKIRLYHVKPTILAASDGDA